MHISENILKHLGRHIVARELVGLCKVVELRAFVDVFLGYIDRARTVVAKLLLVAREAKVRADKVKSFLDIVVVTITRA